MESFILSPTLDNLSLIYDSPINSPASSIDESIDSLSLIYDSPINSPTSSIDDSDIDSSINSSPSFESNRINYNYCEDRNDIKNILEYDPITFNTEKPLGIKITNITRNGAHEIGLHPSTQKGIAHRSPNTTCSHLFKIYR